MTSRPKNSSSRVIGRLPDTQVRLAPAQLETSSATSPAAALAHRMQDLSASLDRVSGYQNEGDDAGDRAVVGPVVERSALHDDVAAFQLDDGSVDLEIDLALEH